MDIFEFIISRRLLDIEIQNMKLCEELMEERRKAKERQTKIKRLESSLAYYKKECADLKSKMSEHHSVEHLNVNMTHTNTQ